MELSYRRRYPRIEANFPVRYIVDRAEIETRAIKLGAGGLFLAIREHTAPKAQVRVRFQPASFLPIVDAGARVRYQLLGKGIGAEFTDISPEHRQIILQLIYDRMEERRRYPRAAFAVEIDREEEPAIGVTTDLSAGGMFVETRKPPSPGSNFKLRIHLSQGEPILEVNAEVLYTVVNMGIGARFIDISPADRARIEAYITKRS